MKVLIVDPDPHRAPGLAQALVTGGAEVTVAPNGSFALTMLEWNRHDVVISRALIDDMGGHELCAILTLESHRHQCTLVGEDLGTVPDQVRPAMARHGLFRLHVGEFAMPGGPDDAPGPAPAASIASLNTHDTPTFAGWWHGKDVDDGPST